MIIDLETRVGIAKDVDYGTQPEETYQEGNVSKLVHEALIAGGLGRINPSVPLLDIIRPGMSVLLKPNWVFHINRSGQGIRCLVTQPEFILAVMKEIANTKPGCIWIGDAPIQSCVFPEVIPLAWQTKFQQAVDCPVEIIDFRRIILKQDNKKGMVHQEGRDIQNFILFDLGKDSLLEPISLPDGRFRVTGYNPEDLSRKHSTGRHQYLICREAIQADVILNLPKLKCHSKAGITAALKNLVGLNGNKEYLPHHRIGGTVVGGDCYPGLAPIKRLAEFSLDQANRRRDTPAYVQWRRIALRLQNMQRRFGNAELEGGWYGNDTVWRMALDLNRLLIYGRNDGSLSETPLRKIFSLTDGIIAGQGEGPLAPTPIRAGFVTFASSSCYADLVHSALMKFDWEKIPLVREAFQITKFPLTLNGPQNCQEFYQNTCSFIGLTDTAQNIGLNFKAPEGWRGHIEWQGVKI